MSLCVPIEHIVGKTVDRVERTDRDSACIYFTDGSTLYVDEPTTYEPEWLWEQRMDY